MSVVRQDRQPRSVSNRDRLGRPANRSSFHLYLNTKGKPPHLYLLVPEKSNGIRNQITEIHPNYLYLQEGYVLKIGYNPLPVKEIDSIAPCAKSDDRDFESFCNKDYIDRDPPRSRDRHRDKQL